ncbi:FAD-dependent oxidoreductase [Streptomyces jumonjinensis]|uniref:FAD-dependent oxidoreductase n=1 Tax=Streptomyces jumonjinensis TaxID=1945 RepID=UPI00379083B7
MSQNDIAALGPATIAADDPRYTSMVRGMNHRFTGRPDYVRVVSTTEQVRAAVGEAVAAGKRVSVRSGGHGFEDFTTSGVEVLLDLSEMDRVGYDPVRRAFVIEAGATLGHVYRVLFKGWGVTVPAGECPEVGVGGHFTGGGFGNLSRSLGLVVDYMEAVEVVVVDRDGTARTIVASRDPKDPHHDLWWAHTGGGGGNFGVVTRFWMRTPGTEELEPQRQLPRAPAQWRSGMAVWSWDGLSEDAFAALLGDFGAWFERNSAPGSPYEKVHGFLHASHRSGFGVTVGSMIDDSLPDAAKLMDAFFDEVSARVGAEPMFRTQQVKPWLYFSSYPGWGDPGGPDTRRIKIKAAYLRQGYSERQIGAVHRHLSAEGSEAAQLILIGYGGQVNTVAPEATATAQRDSVIKAAYLSVWSAEEQDGPNMTALREMYREVYAETGGVPAPGGGSDGSYVNYADADLADPGWNTSGVPWHTLYYKDNYPRLQRIKERYDPRNEFRHGLSIELPG